jgi:hypothetical protein
MVILTTFNLFGINDTGLFIMPESAVKYRREHYEEEEE